MKTQLLYLHDSYQKNARAKITDLHTEMGQTSVSLDATIFYPQGGGQPADSGIIKSNSGEVHVTHVSYNSGEPLHKGKLQGHLYVGQEVELLIDWDKRYQQMQAHTAGHIVDQAVKNVLPQAKSINGEHGIKKRLYIEFETLVPTEKIAEINEQIAKLIKDNLAISTEMVTKEELEQRHVELPFDLPTNKELRIMQIGNYPPMPDGGTQLKSTGECQPTVVTQIIEKDGKYQVVYELTVKRVQPEVKKKPVQSEGKLNLSTFEQMISTLKKEFTTAQLDLSGNELKTQYLGKKGKLNELAKQLKEVSDKKTAGQLLNELKSYLEEQISYKLTEKSTAKQSWVDMTIPGIKPPVGHLHPISQAINEITHIFEKIGFTRVRYPEVDWDWYAFESLNMPPHHPARDEWETFFISDQTTDNVPYDANQPRKRHPSLVGGKIVLTPHTSNGQVHEMERVGTPPIRMIDIGRCYRRQQDVTHTQMFHQFEGLVVDKGITIQHLKGTLDYFAKEFYGPGTKSRIRPFHFQFTEPSFEVDFSCHLCEGTGLINGEKCRFCKSGWHEVGGAGMVHPNVLKAGGIDPNKYTGFAFGWGVERTYTLKEGLHLDDIRLLYSGELEFLRQF